MESAGHQTTVHVKLDGKDLIATFVFSYQVAITVLVTTPLNVIVRMAGKEHSVISPVVKTVQMVSAPHPMNVYAQMVGPVSTVMLANLALDVNMEHADHTHSHASVGMAGRDLSVMNLPAVWIATMEFASHLAMPIQPTFVCANQDGREQAVTHAHLTGDVLIRMLALVTIPMNVSASTMKLMLWVFATTQP